MARQAHQYSSTGLYHIVFRGMLDRLSGYMWSSYKEYIENNGILDKNFVLDMLSLKEKFSTRQIERITGISRGVIKYAVKQRTSL